MKRYRLPLFLLLVSITLAVGPCPDLEISEFFLVTRVIDGDTIELEGGERVRYIGIDTPETVDPGEPVGCYGPEATEFNTSLVEGKRVRLDYDEERADWYGRTLAYVYLSDGTFVNAELVRQGYARAVSYAPNTKHSSFFMDLQREAMAAWRGLWGECVDITLPYVASSNSEVFHLRDCYHVDRIHDGNKVFFETYQDALDSGRRPCKDCLDDDGGGGVEPEPEPPPDEADDDVIVYITDTGSKYHRDGCRYLSKSKTAITKSEAISKGYTPCSVCKP